MQASIPTASNAKTTRLAGAITSGLPALFLLFDGAMKLVQPAPVSEAMVRLGYPASLSPVLGVILLACLGLYLFPRTAVLGAILLTGYLGGAVTTHLRIGDGLFTLLFPVIVGALVWGGLFLRDERLRALLPLRG
ncbi:MAG TPA: DoxX family protein [Herpetosiphonaceae bacterium]|nr:DoxX family protein [Herpetosiphonaceae bacterium]